jgi:hypothetical protein
MPEPATTPRVFCTKLEAHVNGVEAHHEPAFRFDCSFADARREHKRARAKCAAMAAWAAGTPSGTQRGPLDRPVPEERQPTAQEALQQNAARCG